MNRIHQDFLIRFKTDPSGALLYTAAALEEPSGKDPHGSLLSSPADVALASALSLSALHQAPGKGEGEMTEGAQ